MKRKLLFILRHEEPRDDLKYIVRIALNNDVNIKVLLLRSSYLYDGLPDHFWRDSEPVKFQADLQKILDTGAEIVCNKDSDYPKWGSHYDPDIHSDYAWEYGKATSFKESGMELVDPYEYVANAMKIGFEVIKW